MSELNEIKYEPLLALNGAWQLALRQTIAWWGPAFIIGFVAVSLLVSMPLAIEAALAAAVIYAAVLSKKVSRFKNTIWWQFAAVNGWRLDTQTPPGTVIPPSLQFGHSQTWSPIIQAQLGELTCDILTYYCITGYGKSEQTHNFTVACVPLPQALPHMLLLSKKAHADVQNDMGNGEKLHLEGDFDDYFSLEVEKGQEINVLSVIAPDVMQTLINYNQTEDIEIVGNTLYFIADRDRRDYHDMQLVVRSVVELGQKIIDNLGLTAKQAAVSAPPPAAVLPQNG